MAFIPGNRKELLWKFQREADSLVRRNKDKPIEDVLKILLPELVLTVPLKAFDPLEALDVGIITYKGRVEDELVEECQQNLWQFHINEKDIRKPIWLQISSGGGSIPAGFALISTIHEIQNEGRPVNIHIQGYAASMATVILQAGTVRSMDKYGSFMIHSLSYRKTGSLENHEDYLDISKKEMSMLLDFYAERSGRPVSFFRNLMRRKDKWMTPEEALEYGLIDEITEPPSYKKIRS